MQSQTRHGPCRLTGVLPRFFHLPVEGLYVSDKGLASTSEVRIVPFGSSVQPSSAFQLSFLFLDGSSVHCRVEGSSVAIMLRNLSPSMTLPSGSMDEGESPMLVQPFGCFSLVHVSFTGS